jgi:hypothetical protein
VVHLHFNNYTSEKIDLKLGTPQGSPLSPILSIIYASPLHLARSWDNVTLSMYIDDGNIIAWAPSYRVLASKLCSFYMACHDWCRWAALTIKPEKTEVMFFTRQHPNLNLHSTCPDTIYLPDWELSTYYPVKSSNHVRYLGFHLDHRLSWDKHISVVTARTMSTLKAIQLLGNSVQGLDFGNWHHTYNAICIPILTYGTPLWFCNQKQHIKALQRVQNAVIVVIMGAFCSMPCEPLHQLSAILPIDLQLKKLFTQAAICLLSLPPNSPVLHRLGPPWCSEQGSTVPLPYPSPMHPPNSCIFWLVQQVPVDSCNPPTFNHPPWQRCLPPTNHFSVSQELT